MFAKSNKKLFNYKLVFLGDSSVGKSSIVTRFVENYFQDYKKPTIGATFCTYNITKDNNIIKFEIWDTAGQEIYKSLIPMYYRGSRFAVVVYDVTDHNSYIGAKNWINEVKKNCDPNCIIILVGNKIDLKDKKLIFNDLEEFCLSENIINLQVSAKTGENIPDIFKKLADNIPEDYIQNEGYILLDNKNNNKNCCFTF